MIWVRRIVVVLCLLMLQVGSAGAEKADWYDKEYDFSKARRVLIYDMTFAKDSELNNDLMETVLQEEYLKNAARPKYILMRPDKAQVLSPENPKLAADLYVTAELLKWHDDSYVKPGYTSWESRTSKRKRKHSDGSTTEETYETEVPVYHPEKTVYTSTVRLKFEVFDAKTGKRVMARDELRLRDDSKNGQQGIFGRICKSFFDDMGKRLKKESE